MLLHSTLFSFFSRGVWQACLYLFRCGARADVDPDARRARASACFFRGATNNGSLTRGVSLGRLERGVGSPDGRSDVERAHEVGTPTRARKAFQLLSSPRDRSRCSRLLIIPNKNVSHLIGTGRIQQPTAKRSVFFSTSHSYPLSYHSGLVMSDRI